jgi:hypothetical protein
MAKKESRVMLVYQAGIANIFRVDCFNLSPFGREARRVYQGDFRGAYMLAQGMGMEGAIVRTAWCNAAGDIANTKWSEDRDSQPFSENTHTVHVN